MVIFCVQCTATSLFKKNTIMDLIHAQQGEYLVVTVNTAHINASAALEFKDSINAIDESNSKILLNFKQVEFIDSSGLGAVVSFMKHLGKGRKMDLCALTPTVKNGFSANANGFNILNLLDT